MGEGSVLGREAVASGGRVPPAAVLWGEGFVLGRRPLRFALVAALLRAEKNLKYLKRSCKRKMAGRENPENEKRSCKVLGESIGNRCNNASTFLDFLGK